MKKQKGQAILEFALVLPFFLMLFFGIVYSGLLYSDYLTLTNLARESARSASIQGSAYYKDIREAGAGQTLLTNLFVWNGDESSFLIENAGDSAVKVTLTATRNDNFPGLGLVKYVVPESYTIVYTMYKEASS